MHIVCQSDAEVPEGRCFRLFVLRDIPREMRYDHRACSLTVKRDSKILYRMDIQKHVAVVIRRMEHARMRRYGLTPLLRLCIAALLVGVPQLEREPMRVRYLAFYIQTSHPCARSVRTGEEHIPHCILSVFTEEKHILQVRKEPFACQVQLPFAEPAVPVGAQGSRMRVFGF